MLVEWIYTIGYLSLLAGGTFLVLVPRKFKPQTVVCFEAGACGIVLNQQEGWVEVIQPLLKEGGVEYRTETFIPESLKRLPSSHPSARVFAQIAPPLVQRSQLRDQQLDLATRTQKLQQLLPKLRVSAVYSNRLDLLERSYEQLLKLEQQNTTLLETLDSYVYAALTHGQVQQTISEWESLPDPILLYTQQQQLQQDLQALQVELAVMDEL